jgi:hypothetical protein
MITKTINKIRSKYSHYKEWRTRIADVIASNDNQYIPRHPNAGKILGNKQIMHNGQEIVSGSYYGKGITKMLTKNKGVHEPQEERVFQEVLKTMPANAIMVELGAYWAFYSMWFLQQIPKGKTYLYEPEVLNLEFGKKNFELNKLEGDFNQAFISAEVDLKNQPPVINLPHIVETKKLEKIDILHCDIQGHEVELLSTATDLFKKGTVGYLFISTHSDQLHQKCLEIIKACSFEVIAEANMQETYSVDGLIVAKHIEYKGINTINISKKSIN